MVLIECRGDGRAGAATHLVADPIHYRLTEVRLQRPLMSRLERVDAFDGAQDRFLDEVVGIHQVARPAWQAAAGPAPERRQAAGKEASEGSGVGGLREAP